MLLFPYALLSSISTGMNFPISMDFTIFLALFPLAPRRSIFSFPHFFLFECSLIVADLEDGAAPPKCALFLIPSWSIFTRR